jgi:predicted nucleic acid-binding protein
MPGKVVLDSGVIAAIFFLEDASDAAISCVRDQECVTVDLAIAEVANVAWKKSVVFHQDPGMVAEALEGALAFIGETCEVLPAGDLAAEAFALACRENITVYDALFVAAAERKGIPLVTTDAALHAKTLERHAVRLLA